MKVPPQILIIDDDAKVGRMLSRRIKRMGMNPILVNNGKDGLKMSFELSPDLILLDIRMPGMDGYTVIKILRAKGYTGLVVACSASISTMEAEMTIKFGCDYFIGKPIDSTFETQIIQLIKS